DRTKKLLSVFGKTAEIDERLMDAMTALSGCAPAYLSVILEAMNHAGSEAGLPRELALVASAQSMIGVGKLVLEAHKTPLEIRDMVATPGGVTVEGLRELGKVPIEHAFIRAIEAAVEKSKKMSRSLTEKGVDCGS
ncbi:MAG: pyrroline-5-carboxylate reductase dimerization domain-containing protein, partial [Candidatus Bathyarchaeia archaeon]